MGNSESSNPIRNMDKRTARREYKEDFIRGIENYKNKLAVQRGNQIQDTNRLQRWQDGDIKVFVRKRPIFNHELANGEFDVISCISNHVIIHDARMHSDMKRQILNHHEFEFDYVFSDQVNNSTVYQQSARPLVEIACKGGFATAMVYGQTGSGKTFTMTSIYSQAAEDIFQTLHSDVERFSQQPTVSLSFIEIAGDNVCDLLNGFMPTQLRTAADGTVHAFPVTEPTVSSAEELMALIQHGLNIRTTAATGVHDASSRSHAILRIYVQRYDLRSDGQEDLVEGVLTLVDLAGSEHRIDSMYHGKERRKETSQINASLMALKECIRARSIGASTGQHVYRKSKLTLALKNSFALPSARTIVIATVSPASKDTEHSLNTLRHACIMHGQDSNQVDKDETRFATGGITTVEYIGEVNVASIARRNRQHKKVNGEIENIKSSNGNQLDNRAARADNQEVELTDKMKRKMRRMAEVKSFGALEPRLKELLKSHRENLGNERKQLARFQRVLGAGPSVDDAGIVMSMEKFREELVMAHDQTVESEESDEEVDRPTATERSSADVYSARPSSRGKQYDDDFEPPSRPSSALLPTAKSHSEKTTPVMAISIAQLYDCIFLVQDIVHPSALTRQLLALCQLHGYPQKEIEAFFTSKGIAFPSAVSHSTPAQPTRPSSASNTQSTATYSVNSNRATTPTTARRQSSGSSSTAGLTPTAKVKAHLQTQSRPSSRSHSAVEQEDSKVLLTSRTGSGGSTRSAAGGGDLSSRSTSTPRQSKSPYRRTMVSSQASAPTTNSAAAATAAADRAQSSHAVEELSWAKQQLEQEAIQRKARQEAAKKFRLEKEERDRRKAEELKAKGKALAAAPPPVEPVELPIEVLAAKELAEVNRLQGLLDVDSRAPPENRMSSAMQYGLKKQIALLKAAVLKKERARTQPKDANRMVIEAEPPRKEVEAPQASQRVRNSREDLEGMSKNHSRKEAVDYSKLYESDRWEDRQAEDDHYYHTEVNDSAQDADYALSALGRPLSKKLAEKVSSHHHQHGGRRAPMTEQDRILEGGIARVEGRAFNTSATAGNGGILGTLIDYNNDFGTVTVTKPNSTKYLQERVMR